MTPKEILIAYLLHKVNLADWHGVSDAANDIRVLEAELAGEQKVYRVQADKASHDKILEPQ